jgi:2-methylcitrate dehydratase PrpD
MASTLAEKPARLSKPASAVLGEFACSLTFREVGRDVIDAVKLATVDCVAAILSSRHESVSHAVVTRARRTGPGDATVLGWDDVRVVPETAALVNGTMAHATDYDDVSFSMWGHATAPVLPAVLAASEHADLSGPDFLVALLAGLEVEMKLGAAVAPGHYLAGWHATSSIGVFGAAAGAARALSTDSEVVTAALGMAASRAAGLRVNFGSMTKPLHVGFAARDGTEVAFLASAGVTSRPGAIEDPFGFLHVMAGGAHNLEAMLGILGKPFAIVDPGLSFKLYPSCSDTHVAVDTLLSLMRKQSLDTLDIAAVRVGVTKSVADNLIYHQPETGLEGKFSMEYCLARALQRGTLELNDFTDTAVRDASTRALIHRIEMYVDPAIDERSFCSPATIEITTNRSQAFTETGTTARGHAGRPLEISDLRRKFARCAEGTLSPHETEAAFESLMAIETATSIRDIARALTPATTHQQKAPL